MKAKILTKGPAVKSFSEATSLLFFPACLKMKRGRFFLSQEDGATAIEYALIASIVSIVIVAGLILIGPRLSAIFQDVSTSL